MKKAFTLLELVFVVVVVGILAAVIIPRTKTNPLQEAALQVQSHIRYAQHLAIMDDKFDPNDKSWFKKRWQIIFAKQKNTDEKWAYTIFADIAGKDSGKPNKDEIAVNPMNHTERMTGGYNSAQELNVSSPNFVGMKSMNLGESYGIKDITFTCNQRIAFDYLGRPIKSDLSKNNKAYDSNDLITSRCEITLKDADENITIAINKATGYTCILDNTTQKCQN